jgi:succinoglycan biosynthesis protein ExoO
MVARNAEDHIDAALRTARAQTFRHIEIVVVDDGSTDATATIVRAHARADERVRLVAGPREGLAAVRNASLEAARGRYAAILDSDDLLHPEHVEVLFGIATRHRAEIAAANMLCFTDTAPRRAHRFARGAAWNEERIVSAAQFVASGRLGGKAPSLGYLKPLFDLRFLRASGLGYDETLRIGEDYDLVDRALRAGARYVISPRMTYFYRRHEGSTSHRLARSDLEALLAAERAKRGPGDGEGLARASVLRERALERTLAHLETVEALKALAPRAALRHIAREPGVLPMLAASAVEGLARRLRGVLSRKAAAEGQAPRALLLGPASAGSAIADAAQRLGAQGFELHRVGRTDRAGTDARIARAGPYAAILLTDASVARLVPFALSPGAPLIGDATLDPALVDIVATAGGDGRGREHRSGRVPLAEAIARFRPDAAIAPTG